MMSGMGRRPVWADQRTPRIVALNTWKAKEEQSRKRGSTTLSDRRTRKFAEEWHLQMQGHKTQSRIRDSVGQLTRDPRSLLTRDPQGSQVAADRSCQKQPTSTNDQPKRKRDADIDPHIPLPRMTREQKAEGTNAPMKKPDSKSSTPNSMPKTIGATKRKAQSQIEDEEAYQPSTSRSSNQTSDPSDQDRSVKAHESSSAQKEEETRSTKGRKRHAVNQLDEERRPRVELRTNEDTKSHTREEEDPNRRDQREIAKNSSTREDTKTNTSRGDKWTVEGANMNSNSKGEARPPKQVHAETSGNASQGAILGASCDEGDRIIAQSRGKRKRNSETGEPAKEEQQRAGGKKAKEKAEAASVIGRAKKEKERCQICNGVISSAESGTQCPPGPKELGFVPGATSCRDCVAHLLKRLQWYLDDQKTKYPSRTKKHAESS